MATMSVSIAPSIDVAGKGTAVAENIIDRIVEQNLGVYEAAPSRLQEDVSQEAQVAHDYRGRLVYELLQNSDDAMEGQGTDRDSVVFRVTDDALWMANSGRPLTDGDVQGLCGLGASSKVDAVGTRRASIGHKGLGFKSVLEITASPIVYSTSCSFRLGAEQAEPHVRALFDRLGQPVPRSVPAMRFPVEIESGDESVWNELRSAGMNTAFRFPFRDGLTPENVEALADGLLTLPLTTVLFLKHLESVVVEVERTGRSQRQEWLIDRALQTGGGWSPVPGFGGSGLYRVGVLSSAGHEASFYVAHDEVVEIGANRVGLSGPSWEGVDVTEVSVATTVDAGGEMPADWRRFHVFLPTAEPCPYPMLVNGAFATDLSRQHVRVTDESGDYNSHLVRHAAELFVDQLLPILMSESPERVLEVLDRGNAPQGGDAAALLHRSLTAALADVPLLPDEQGRHLILANSVLPSTVVEAEGELFRSVLPEDAGWENASFPSRPYCQGRWARVAGDHGARQLLPVECVVALGGADPVRSAAREHLSGYYEVDPVLQLCALLWERADVETRGELEAVVRHQPVFPVHRHQDGRIERVTLAEDAAFYPPQSARKDFPLRGLRFMCHSMCWGALNKNERQTMLGDQIQTWAALFDVKEFRFQEVMQASVLPPLSLSPSAEELEWRKDLESLDSLAAICQLAGSFSKPDRPLRYQRLHSDRAIFNLSRLPVPCRGSDGSEEWIPAYQVYFGSDWIAKRSFETVVDAVLSTSGANSITAHFLAGPSEFLGLIGDDDNPEESPDAEDHDLDLDDEVELDEDVDRALETSESERWFNFFSWIGVNRAARLIHFHDVEDRDSGWLKTKELGQPQGRAFRDLGSTWTSFRADLDAMLATRPDREDVVPYLYELHDLDQVSALIYAAEQDATSTVAESLFEHIVANWSILGALVDAQIALVEKDKWPGARAKPQRARSDELVTVGDNLWLHRLRQAGICPTSRGPRRPEVTWKRTRELERRFTSERGRRDASELVPVLQHGDHLSANALKAVCERLGVRSELSPSTFTIDDANHLCRQLERLYGDAEIQSSALRHVIRPSYRAMFELLSGSAAKAAEPVLGDAPLLADTDGGWSFQPAREVLFAGTSGLKERSGLAGRVPIFVLEAEPAAEASLASIFGCRDLERVLDWHPSPGDSAHESDEEQARFRSGLASLIPPLLARLRAERSRPRDLTDLREFAERIEPVTDLELSCTLDGEHLDELSTRSYFVRPRVGTAPFQGFVVWDGDVWPPSPDSAQRLAMALADTLGVNLVETFLAFINSSDDQRTQLLAIAGAAGHLADVLDELDEPSEQPPVDEENEHVPDAGPTAAPGADDVPASNRPSIPDETPGPAAPLVPLHEFRLLLIEGEPLIMEGEAGSNGNGDNEGSGNHGSGTGGSGGRAPAGTDLSALDSLGMRITLAYEERRLRGLGDQVAVIAGSEATGAGESLVVEVHTPAAIQRAEELNEHVAQVMSQLEASGVSRIFPGFDILSIRDGKVDRLIELKSSGIDARVQSMSWNEWKSAANNALRESFWLYLVGNLRSDLSHAAPYVRAIRDPFGSLSGNTVEQRLLRRAVQLRVREFEHAEHLDLSVACPDGGCE